MVRLPPRSTLTDTLFPDTTRCRSHGDGTLQLPVSSVSVNAGATLSLTPGQAAVFTDVASCASSSGAPAGTSGWVLGTYSYDGTSTGDRKSTRLNSSH